MSDTSNVSELNPPGTRPGGSNGGGGRDLPSRVAAIEAHMQHMATKAWVLAGVVGGMVSAALVTLAIIRVFFPPVSG